MSSSSCRRKKSTIFCLFSFQKPKKTKNEKKKKKKKKKKHSLFLFGFSPSFSFFLPLLLLLMTRLASVAVFLTALATVSARQCPSTSQCGCAWTNGGRNCGNDDYSPCYATCCKCGSSSTQQQQQQRWTPPAAETRSRCETVLGLSCDAASRCAHGHHVGYCPGRDVCCKRASSSNTGWNQPAHGNNNGGGAASSGTGAPNVTPIGGWVSNGQTTRYWDCCKPHGAWPDKVVGARGVVRTCRRDGVAKADPNDKNVCKGGGGRGIAYACNNQAAFQGSDGTYYGFAAAFKDMCTCYELSFTSGLPRGKSMVVQVTNIGDLNSPNHFDLQLPGGGFGENNGCSMPEPGRARLNGPGQWDQSRYPRSAWGPVSNENRGGVSSIRMCDSLPGPLQEGCRIRFNFIGDNPSMRYRQVKCPAEIVSRSGCERNN
eukprot:TRINITY_DN672_c0_g1_i3.p2 TRINITY_DN672_c0_g1~~TRINITY_DN672_c0_g1_i3.p2  ORF type:complete len:429 (-),score=154.38 TRINITY_DN672_c0_g1_i3:50-1336(-)